MKLLLVNVYPADTMAEYMLSAYVLKAYLDKYGHNISTQVLNFSLETIPEDIANQITKENPDAAGYSCYVWNMDKIKSTTHLLKGKYVQIFGGPEISRQNIDTTKDADYCITGEGEKQLLSLVESLQGEDNRKSKDQSDSVTELDEIPSPYLDGAMPEKLYKRNMALLETQRGCKYRCKFCVYHKNLPRIRYYSLERVEKELRFLIKDKGVFALRIFDATLTSDLARAKKIIKYLINLKKEARLPWIYWEWRWEDVDEEFIRLLGEMKYREQICNSNSLNPLDRPQHYSEMLEGYTAINSIGVESFNPESMKAVSRAPIDAQKFAQVMGWVKQYNIALKMDLIMDLPHETYWSYWQEVEGLLPYLEDTDHILNIHLLEILPGSKLEEDAGKYGLVYDKEAPHMVTSTDGFSNDELASSSKLTALLLRFLNSPLRGKLLADFSFRRKQDKNLTLEKFMSTLYQRIKRDLPDIKLVTAGMVGEDYWESQIYEDIPSKWLTSFLTR
jgi:hypothetical protein